jgi:TolB-like protein/class 3 adenylate cyclase/Flp pilus assembly protein TadD
MPPDQEPRRKLAAILSADVAGFSRLMGEDEAATLAALTACREVFAQRIAQHHGRVVDTAGDSVLATFDSVGEAVRCAVDVQQALQARNAALPAARRMSFRVGVNLGDVIEQTDGSIYGDGVNIAARLQALADPGGICLSEDVARQVQNKIELPLLRLGKADLKNIQIPVGIFRLVLPWEHKHLPGSERLAFSMRQRQMRRALLGAGGLLAAGALAGGWVWRRQAQTGLINNRIAVLPFVSMSARDEDEYFVDGMTEELISRLSRVQGLEVIARTSIASYKGSKKTIAEIASDLDVGTVLEGSVRMSGGKVRVTAQLINVANEAHLWSEDYDRELKDIFMVQTDIAKHVVSALATRLALAAASTPSGLITADARGGGTKDLDAYNAYLKGRFYYNKGTVEDLHKAIPHFEEAIRRDSSYALPYSGLADTYGNLAGYEGATAELYAKVRSAAEKALQLDDSLAEAHTSLGIVKAFYDYDLAGAGDSFRRALALNPNSAMAHDWYSYYLLFFARWEEAIALQRKAVQLDPLALIINTDLGWVLAHAGRYDEMIEHLHKVLELDPTNALLLGALGRGYTEKGMYREALAALQKRVDTAGREPEVLSFMAQAHALGGNTAKALQLVEEAKQRAKNLPGQAWNITNPYRALAMRDERYRNDMFRWLDKAYEERAMGLVFISSGEWKPFRDDPRMIAFRKKLALPP